MLAVIRVRGNAKIRHTLEKTMQLLKLTRVNHCVIVDEKQLPMIKKVESYVTYGTISEKTLVKLLKKRGRTSGNKRITAGALSGKKINGFEELAREALKSPHALKEAGIKPVFRLNAPKKGHARSGIKKPFALGGALGNRKERINVLLERMI